MTFTDAAQEVLQQTGHPLHYKEITEIAIEQNLLSHVGKSPEVTMGARLAATLKKGGDDNPLIRVKPGVFALRDWDEETIKKGLEIKRAPKKKKKEDEPKEAKEAAKSKAADDGDDDAKDEPKAKKKVDVADDPQSPDEAMRAEIAAGAKEVFAVEDDDDQPILKRKERDDDGDADSGEGRGRRRRRRRRRGRSSSASGGNAADEGNGMPAYTAAPAFEGSQPEKRGGGGMPRGPQVIELTPEDAPSLDGLAGRELADGVALILGTFDRTVGAVSLRQIAETAQRRGKLSGDLQLAQSQIAAAVRADSVRRGAAGLRPRFRVAGGRVGLTDWLLDNDLARLEREALQAIGRYRDSARRAFARKLSELPGHAFVELCVTLLERVGVGKIRQVKFPGASGVETHLSGVLYAPPGVLQGPIGTGDGAGLGVVIRKDGRDLGRERVTELRGSAHHYDNAKVGWIMTSGQILSGAREEATSDGVMPVTLFDGVAIARMCADNDIAVVRSLHPIAVPDVDFFEALRAT